MSVCLKCAELLKWLAGWRCGPCVCSIWCMLLHSLKMWYYVMFYCLGIVFFLTGLFGLKSVPCFHHLRTASVHWRWLRKNVVSKSKKNPKLIYGLTRFINDHIWRILCRENMESDPHTSPGTDGSESVSHTSHSYRSRSHLCLTSLPKRHVWAHLVRAVWGWTGWWISPENIFKLNNCII